MITDMVSRWAFKLFTDGVDTDLIQGIEHWGRMRNLLYTNPKIRPHVAFLLAIRSPKQREREALQRHSQ